MYMHVGINVYQRRCVSAPLCVPQTQDFPYYFESGIEHFNLWSTHPLTREQVEHHIAQHAPHDKEWMMFENPPALMSIPSVCLVDKGY